MPSDDESHDTCDGKAKRGDEGDTALTISAGGNEQSVDVKNQENNFEPTKRTKKPKRKRNASVKTDSESSDESEKEIDDDILDEDERKRETAAVFSHFRVLDEKYRSKSSGRQYSLNMCVCVYCESEFDRGLQVQQGSNHTNPPLVKMMKTRPVCLLHLKNCSAFQRHIESTSHEADADLIVESHPGTSDIPLEQKKRKKEINAAADRENNNQPCEEEQRKYEDEAGKETTKRRKTIAEVNSYPKGENKGVVQKNLKIEDVDSKVEDTVAIFSHFRILDERFRSKRSGREHGMRMCICLHCSFKMRKVRRECLLHLKKCASFHLHSEFTGQSDPFVAMYPDTGIPVAPRDLQKINNGATNIEPLHRRGNTQKMKTDKKPAVESELRINNGFEPPNVSGNHYPDVFVPFSRRIDDLPLKPKNHEMDDESPNQKYAEVFSQFRRLDECWRSKSGREFPGAYLCVCLHCEAEYTASVQSDQSSTPVVKAPNKRPHRRRDCLAHLRRCNAYHRHLRSAGQVDPFAKYYQFIKRERGDTPDVPGSPGALLGFNNDINGDAANPLALSSDISLPEQETDPERNVELPYRTRMRENAEIYAHFRRLNEKSSDKVYLCLCLYCEAEYKSGMESADCSQWVDHFPVKLRRFRPHCLSHLKDCSAWKRHLQSSGQVDPFEKLYKRKRGRPPWKGTGKVQRRPRRAAAKITEDDGLCYMDGFEEDGEEEEEKEEESASTNMLPMAPDNVMANFRKLRVEKKCICNFCEIEFQSRDYLPAALTILEPVKIDDTVEKCREHLQGCDAFRRFQEQVKSTSFANRRQTV